MGGLIVGLRLSTSRGNVRQVFSENVTFYPAMVSNGSVAGVARDRRAGGLSASMYLLTVSLWMPNSLAIPRIDRPASLACCTAFQRSFCRNIDHGMLRLPTTRPRPHRQWHRRDISAGQLAKTFP